MSTPHDALFRSTFAVPFHAAGWLQSVLPEPLAAAIDWTSLQPAQERAAGLRLSAYPADAVFAAQLHVGDPPLLLLIEHKSTGNLVQTAQLLRYAVHLRSSLRDDTSGCEPLVVPVLLHHGPTLAGIDNPVRGLPAPLAAALGPLQPASASSSTTSRRPPRTSCAGQGSLRAPS